MDANAAVLAGVSVMDVATGVVGVPPPSLELPLQAEAEARSRIAENVRVARIIR